MPLIEIVSKPEIRSPEEASKYLVTLRQLLRYLEICDGNMEEGSLRCDVNISLRRPGDKLGTKTEIKNLNSFKAVEMGIRFEIERQAGVLRSGGRIEQVTNLWDSGQKKLLTMRSKEYAHDYRYFPEPDLLPLDVDAAWIEKMRAALPELPLAREKRFREKLGLPAYDANVLCAEKGLADYYESRRGRGERFEARGELGHARDSRGDEIGRRIRSRLRRRLRPNDSPGSSLSFRAASSATRRAERFSRKWSNRAIRPRRLWKGSASHR